MRAPSPGGSSVAIAASLGSEEGDEEREMREHRDDMQGAAEDQDAREDYLVPTLTDLGSFEELTRNAVGPNPDAEGSS
jgi:hypothetical protein